MLLRKSIRSLPNNLGSVLKMMEERRVPRANTFSSLLPQMLQIDPSERITVRSAGSGAALRFPFLSPCPTYYLPPPGPEGHALPPL